MKSTCEKTYFKKKKKVKLMWKKKKSQRKGKSRGCTYIFKSTCKKRIEDQNMKKNNDKKKEKGRKDKTGNPFP